MSRASDVALRKRQAVSRGNSQHQLDDIDARHHLGDGVLDLEARIDLEKIIVVAAQDEFDGAHAAIVQALAEPRRVGHHPLALVRGEICGRGFLDQFLVPTLQRAFALEQMNDVAFAVPGNLHFDVTSVLDQLFDDQPGVAEPVFGFAHGGFDFAGQSVGMRDGTHALAATACRRLQHRRQAEFMHDVGDRCGVVARRLAAGHGRHAGRFGLALGGCLVAQPFDDVRCRPDEHKSRRLDGAGKFGILRQKAEPGMNGLGAGGLCRGDHGVDPQITLACGGAADQEDSLIVLTCNDPASAEEWTPATSRRPVASRFESWRQAISPRLAIRIL